MSTLEVKYSESVVDPLMDMCIDGLTRVEERAESIPVWRGRCARGRVNMMVIELWYIVLSQLTPRQQCKWVTLQASLQPTADRNEEIGDV